MNDLAENIIPIKKNDNYSITTGKVVSVNLTEFTIEIERETYKAKKAFSCLIEPIKNDIVLCAKNDDYNFHIISIIERFEDKDITIKFPSDADISADSGDINIRACENYSVLSNNINLFSKKAVHKSKNAYFAYDYTTATGKDFQGNFKKIKIISNLINTMAKQVIDKFIGYIRSTEDNDMVQSGQMTRKTDGLYALDSKHTIMNSKKSTKIDGDKILMG